ncbi:YhjD/YihY/BrkB family envelope integrity protein [Actinoplanes sp. NPDC048796]|uniref:YhjD/YihY/BrkB family envelope integrity protein n=1 Tax=Actinoplanes sp. NPDC048796 TaxID=3155640 RepID=UPI0033C9FDF0
MTRGPPPAGLPHRWLTALGFLLGVAVNLVLACGALTGLPRVRMPWRRLIGPALLVAVAMELLKTIGGVYVRLTEANPVYQLVAGAVGLLVFLNAINQMFLFAAALTATSTTGRPADLAEHGGRPVPGPDATPVER